MLKLYPIASTTFDNTASSAEFIAFWESVEIPPNSVCYGVYFNYQETHYDFAIATELPNHHQPIIVEDLSWYEKFPTKTDLIANTWQGIWNKHKQGLLKRAFSIDFEKYLPDGKVEIYIAVSPHC